MGVFSLLFCSASGAPHTREEIDLLLELENDQNNQIEVVDISKLKSPTDVQSIEAKKEIPLGSQFAIAHIFPEREGLVTGHRIPLHLFPLETQSKILEVPNVAAANVEDISRGESRENIQTGRYVNTASFRQPTTESTTTVTSTTTAPTKITTHESPVFKHAEVLLEQLGGQSEQDSTYSRSLRIFAPPSFF